MPGFTMATYEWFRTYKMPAGKPPNVFAFNGAAKDRAYALSIIEENYQFWSELLAGKIENSGLCLYAPAVTTRSLSLTLTVATARTALLRAPTRSTSTPSPTSPPAC